MKKIKAFNFVELMMVMLILGIVITLTMPLIKNIKEDDDIYRSYMKKANQEVIDAFTMGMLRNPSVRDMSVIPSAELPTSETANCQKIRNLFNDAINSIACNGNVGVVAGDNATCARNVVSTDFPDNLDLSDQPFIVLGGKSTMIFVYNDDAPPIYGYVYVDMNGNKSPNEMCKDRYRFVIYRNSVAMDTEAQTAAGANNPYACSFNL